MLGEVLAVVTAGVWASSTILSAKALKEIDSVSANLLRTLFAALSMLLVAVLVGEIQTISTLDAYGLVFVILAAIVGNGVGETCFLHSIALIGVARSNTIAYTSPFFTMILATVFLGEPFLPKYLIGMIIMFGAIMLSLTTKIESEARNNGRGALTALTTAICWSLGSIFVAYGLRNINVILTNTIRYSVLFPFLLPWSRRCRKKTKLSRISLALMAASGIIGLTFGGLLFLSSIQLIGVSRTIPLSSSAPVYASVMSSLFLKEKVTLRIIISSLMVLIGTYFLV